MPKQDSGWARRADVHQQMADMMFGHADPSGLLRTAVLTKDSPQSVIEAVAA
jgi:hypothetical protein